MKKNKMFDFLVSRAAPTIRGYAERLKSTQQSPKWHPEGDVEIHTKIVLNKAVKDGDIDIIMAAFFHDLGKVDKTKIEDKKISSPEHEDVSKALAKYSRGWIGSFGANPDTVIWLVENHMRIKFLDEMKAKKRKDLENHAWFPKLQKFARFDSKEDLTTLDVVQAGGNVFKYWFNKFKSFFTK